MKFLELQHELWKDFNPRSRTGSDDPILGRDACTRDFNPRSRTGSDLPNARERPYPENFNPRSRTGSDSLCKIFDYVSPYFNPRSRTGSDEIIWCAFGNPTRFQSTLPHGERRREWNDSGTRHGISIHAPARGATPFRLPAIKAGCISIHAPARGATPERLPEHPADNFNPRSRTGSDLCYGFAGPCGLYFNPRSRTGSDKRPRMVR